MPVRLWFPGEDGHYVNTEPLSPVEPQQNEKSKASRAPLAVFVATRAKQIAEQSAELFPQPSFGAGLG